MSPAGDKQKGAKVDTENAESSAKGAEAHADMVPQQEAREANHEKAALDAVEVAQKEILYIRAEFENYKKRIQREQEQAIRFANKAILMDLLNLGDLFERATSHGKTLKDKADKEVGNFINGVELTRNELNQLMQRFGAEFVGAVNEKFDPEIHEAISQLPAPAGLEAGEEYVAEVVQKGCKLQGKLIKPARVLVGRR